MQQIIKVGVIDDKAFLRKLVIEKLQAFENFEIVMEASNGLEYLKQLSEKNLAALPEIVLMDIAMDGMDGIEATRISRELYPNIQIIMLTVLDSDDKVFQAVCAGANGYVLKDEPGDIIAHAIHEVRMGGGSLSPSIAMKALRLLRGDRSTPKLAHTTPLSDREAEVLQLIAQGQRYKDIAERLFISLDTVKSHARNIYAKLSAGNKVEAIQAARKLGLV